eukprot:gene17337-23937_t
MVTGQSLSTNFTFSENEWGILDVIDKLLAPFMNIQKFLEAESYTTLSFAPIMIFEMREILQKMMLDYSGNDQIIIDGVVGDDDEESSRTELLVVEVTSTNNNTRSIIHELATRMYRKFCERWGSGNEGTIFMEHMFRGNRNIRKGFSKEIMLATVCDPKFKDLFGFNVLDKDLIMNCLKEEMMIEANKLFPPSSSATTAASSSNNSSSTNNNDNDHLINVDNNNNSNNNNASSVISNNVSNKKLTSANYAKQLFKKYHNQNNNNDNNNSSSNNNNNNVVLLDTPARRNETKVENELNLYSLLKPIDEFDEDSLQWWRIHSSSLPILSRVARRYLNIPATSASSERIFSS